MMATLGSIALAALLFMVFGTLRIGPGCGGNCGHCDHACSIEEVLHEPD